ncbi:MAG: glycosyl hydrolase 115 family protein, partial [Bacteroidota bacterium]|nr:glycosyl hydrolase 115 family protein [Bacteroidota bacterium]
MKKIVCLVSFLFLLLSKSYCQNFISEKSETGSFPMVSNDAAPIYTDANDGWLIQNTASLLQDDVEKVTGKKPVIDHTISPSGKNIIIIGSIAQSSFIKQLIQTKKLKTDSLNGKWEAYQMQIVKNPFKGIDNALVIGGSDKRGTAYGVLELSKQIGVSPWYWWADVPVKKKKEIYVSKNIFLQDHPLVKYRGIFINDEAPAFSGWTREIFGGVNHLVYEKIFELLLRLKANYLWPAMWGNAFNDDDTLNPVKN